MYTYIEMDLYHALNRGVDKRTIFQDSQDYVRFIHDMYIFNDVTASNNTLRLMGDFVSPPIKKVRLVDIHGWCLMGNHYHLLLSELVEGGLTLFLRRLNVGYAKYFNERYRRTGTLFQGRTKKLLIDNDSYFLHILHYIHLNPLDMNEGAKEWRNVQVTNLESAFTTLKEYRWSSYKDYAGIKNFPSILTTSLFQDVFEGDYDGSLRKYLTDMEVESLEQLKLEN